MVNPNLECDVSQTDSNLSKCGYVGLGLAKCAWKLCSRCFHERILCVSMVGKAMVNYRSRGGSAWVSDQTILVSDDSCQRFCGSVDFQASFDVFKLKFLP